MDVEITISNYRRFPDSSPAALTLRKGTTALLGANNVGKSSLLKFFYELRPLWQRLAIFDINLARLISRQYRETTHFLGVRDSQEVFHRGNDAAIHVRMRLDVHDGSDGLPALEVPIALDIEIGRDSRWQAQVFVGDEPWGSSQIDFQGTQLTLGPTLNRPPCDLSRLRAVCNALASTYFIPSFRNAINAGAGNYFDIPVGQALIQQWDSLKRGDNIASRRTTRDITFVLAQIFGYSHLEINASANQTTLIINTDSETFTLEELGAGFAQFFVVLVGVGVRRPDYVLIDEPELSLHPSLQLTFLSTLESFANGGVIFATHSPGLARSAAQRIYSVRRNSAGSSRVAIYEATPDLPEFLGELSFSGYQELGFDCVLLVEGVTEVKTFHQFLRLYGKEQKVVVMPMGGSDLINDKRAQELADLKRITPNIHAVIDSERDDASAPLERARAGFTEVCKGLQIDCHVLERRAIENYLPQHAIDRALGRGHSELKPYDKLPKSNAGGWSKNDNWRIAREMNNEDLQSTDLACFLNSLTVRDSSPRG